MDLEEGGSVLEGEVGGPGGLVEVVLGEGEDEAEGDLTGTDGGEAGGHGFEGAGGVAHGVVGGGDAVEADGQDVGEAGEGVETALVEEHAVGGDGGAHAAVAGSAEELREGLVEG